MAGFFVVNKCKQSLEAFERPIWPVTDILGLFLCFIVFYLLYQQIYYIFVGKWKRKRK